MKPAIKRLLIGIGLLCLVLASFIAGIFSKEMFWIDPPPLQSTTTTILVSPPPDGSLYSTEDYYRANLAVEYFLSQENEKPEYDQLDLKYWGVLASG